MTKKKFLSLLKMGYIILYKTDGSKVGRLIEKKQLSEGFIPEHACYTHVEVSGGGQHSINISPPVSKLIDITKRHKGRYIKVVRYKNEEYEKSKRYKVAYFSASLCNKGYDFRGVISFVFRWIKQNNRLYFCSEGALWSLQKVFPAVLYKLKPQRCMPAHFCLPRDFETVYEGIVL